MKYYEDGDGNLYAFEEDGSQDAFIGEGLTLLTTEEADAALTPDAETTITLAKARIYADFEACYRANIEAYTAQPYSQADITSWPMQEAESLEYMDNEFATVEWMSAHSAFTGIPKNQIALAVWQRTGWYKAQYVVLTAIRFNALAAIDALGATPDQEDLDAVVDAVDWPVYEAP